MPNWPVTTVYDSPGTASWEWPEGQTIAQVEVWAGSGGGGYAVDTTGGGGGSGGSYARAWVYKTETATTIELVIGAGGGPEEDGEDSTATQEAELIASAYRGLGAIGTVGGGASTGTVGGQSLQASGEGGDGSALSRGGAGGGSTAGQNRGGNLGGGPSIDYGRGGGGRTPAGGARGGDGGQGAHHDIPTDTDIAAVDAETIVGFGGGGGGGSVGVVDGAPASGGHGRARVTCPPQGSGSDCCCGCPPGFTKDSEGMPDSLSIALSPGGSPADLPDDTVIDSCDGKPVYQKWSRNGAFTAILAGIIWDFSELGGPTDGACGGSCCFHYAGRDGEAGVSPFPTVVIGASVLSNEYVECDTVECCGDANWQEYHDAYNATLAPSHMLCCSSRCDRCSFGDIYTVTGGVAYGPGPVTVDGETSHLYICYSEPVVTIFASVAISVTCNNVSGSFGYTSAGCHNEDTGWPSCSRAAVTTGSPSSSTTTSTAYATVVASADLTGVAGDTLWEKIQNATEWTGTFGSGGCSCSGGGCSDSITRAEYTYCVTPECNYTPGCGGSTVTDEDDHPVDQICFFDGGDINTVTVTGDP